MTEKLDEKHMDCVLYENHSLFHNSYFLVKFVPQFMEYFIVVQSENRHDIQINYKWAIKQCAMRTRQRLQGRTFLTFFAPVGKFFSVRCEMSSYYRIFLPRTTHID